MNKYIRVLILIIVIIFTFSLLGCSNNTRVSELEKTITDLQKQISDMESTTTTTTVAETTTEETTTTAAETTTVVETTAAVVETGYTIGDTGPAGGLIFYINPNYETDGWRYLEASLNDQSDNIQWYNGTYVKTGPTATAVGTGKANTQKIVSVQGDGSYAAKLCDDLTINGYDDWFLPSKDELNEMYVNLDLKGLAGFQPDKYWSSTEHNADNAWFLNFHTGVEYNNFEKFLKFRVRAIRAFN